MRLSHPLDDLFQNRSHVKVLRALHAVPEGVEVSTREVARRAGITHPTASGVLESLRTQGVIHVRRMVWADQYRVNPGHVLWQKIRPLLRWLSSKNAVEYESRRARAGESAEALKRASRFVVWAQDVVRG